MRFARFAVSFLALSACALSFSAASAQAAGGASKLFFIPASSGYGISECFAPGANCGKVVADAYCESKGFGTALAYGRADDITASIPSSSKDAKPFETGSYVVKCGE
jgi:hypothetical protein